MKILGIDFGTKNVGIASSDIEGRVAFPKTILKRGDNLMFSVKKIAEEEDIHHVVLGVPKNVEAEWQKDVINFQDELKREGFVVELQDESFSSHEAHQGAYGMGLKLNETDAVAAAFILQRYLDKQHGNN